MGSPKQLLRLGERTLLEHTLANLRAAKEVSEIVTVLGASAEEIRPLISGGVKAVMNDAFRDGMGRSLQAGLQALSPDTAATFVVLADQPLVKPETLNRMMAEYRQHRPQILIPLYRGFRGNPVLLDRSVFPEIAQLGGDTGCRAIFGDHLENIRKLEVDDIGIQLDADRPPDLETLKTAYNGGQVATNRYETKPGEAAAEIVVVGRESVATAIVKIAHVLRYRVTVVDPLLTFEEMPGATGILRALNFSELPEAARRFCVVASMGRFDEEAIEQAIKAQFPYIALVANQKRSQEVLRSLELLGVAKTELAKVRTKPGLAIGAQTQEEIALSVVGEIVSGVRLPSANRGV